MTNYAITQCESGAGGRPRRYAPQSIAAITNFQYVPVTHELVRAGDNARTLVVGELLAGGTNIDVLLSHIAEVLLAKATFRLNARGHRLRQRHRNSGLVAGKDFRAAVVAAIGNSLEFIDAEDFFRPASDVGELCSI